MSGISRAAARALNRLAGRWDIEIRRKGRPAQTEDLLRGLKEAAPDTGTVLDVGAAFGDFSRSCARVFPQAAYVLIEPLSEYEPFLEAAVHEIPKARLVAAAAGARGGTAVLNVHRDLLGSSLLPENEGSSVDGTPRTVPAVRLDDLAQDLELQGRFILKVDVQGAELQVLAGAEKVLQDTSLVLLEVSFFDFFKGGAQADEVVNTMGSLGFALQDIANLDYRPLDGALAQADFVFIERSNPFRSQAAYASPEQRLRQDQAAAAHLNERRRDLDRGR